MRGKKDGEAKRGPRGVDEKGEAGDGDGGTRGEEAGKRGMGGKLERNSNFRPHFSSSINSYLYATPCFLSIRARSSLPAEFPRDIEANLSKYFAARDRESAVRSRSKRARTEIAKLANILPL